MKVLSGVNRSTFAWAAIKSTAAGPYFVRAINAVGSVDSSTFTVEVQDKPVIDTQPAATLSAQADQTATIACAAHGTDTLATPLRYQWQFNSLNISDGAGYAGSTTKTLTINPVHWRHHGTYRCVVTNAVGTVTTKNCVFTVVSYPVILTQPVTSKKIAKGATGSLTVVAGGTGVLKYQWYKDNNIIPGAVAATLALSKASVTNTNGSYKVVVTTTLPPMPGTATSDVSVVTVEDPPVPGVIISSLGRLSIGVGEHFALSVNALGSPTLKYQWQRNNVDISGATNSSLDFPSAQSTDVASYRVKVTNDVGVVYSAAAAIKVVTKPGITKDPLPLSLYEYDTATFTVTASGTPPFAYQWYYNNVAIPATNATARTASLVIKGIRIIDTKGNSNAGTYHVVVSNGAGSTTSKDVTLVISPVPPPTLTDVRPIIVSAGDTILINGTNFNWLTGIKLGSKSLSFVKKSATEVTVTLPPLSSVATPSGDLVITTLGGQVTYGTPITVVTNDLECDLFRNAKILTFNGYLYNGVCSNKGATYGAGDYYVVGETVWFRWTAPKSGMVTLDDEGTIFHSAVAIFAGPHLPTSPYQLSYIGQFFDHHGATGDGGLSSDTSNYSFYATQDQDYYIIMDSVHTYFSGFEPDDGDAEVSIAYDLAAPRALFTADFETSDGYTAGPLNGQQGWHVAGGSAAVVASSASDHAAAIGGTATADSVIAWHGSGDDQVTGGQVIHATADLTVRTTIGTPESFHWGLFDQAGHPAIALSFDASTGELTTQPAATAVPQIFVPNVTYPVTFTLNKSTGEWTIFLSGHQIASGTGWKAPDPGLVTIGGVWQPATGSQTGGSIEFDNVVVTAIDRPKATPYAQPPVKLEQPTNQFLPPNK